MEVVRGETRLLTASGQGGCVKVFSLQSATYQKEPTEEKVTDNIMTDVFDSLIKLQMQVPLVAMEMGHVTCQNKERLSMIKVDSTGQYLALLVSW